MGELANFVTIGSGVLAVAIFIYRWVRRGLDTRRIVYLLSAPETGYRFRSTHAIASKLGIPETRVTYLASRCSKIRRNEKEKETWTLR